MSNDVFSIQQKIQDELKYYLRSQYIGKSPVLLEAFSDEIMDKKGFLHQIPYIESTPAYEKVTDGFASLNVQPQLQEFFSALAEKGLGVYQSPYKHQIEALQAFLNGKDLLVSTGTGSGKTECFMWPLLAKLCSEAVESPDTWEKRGVRTLIMYPMNALVSDQISRLRKLIGDPDDEFLEIFHKFSGEHSRRPQFGMYTGRTPYPGKQDPKRQQEKGIAQFLREIVDRGPNDEYYQVLLHDGKIPAKKDLKNFIGKLERGEHTTDKDDAELITRFEMTALCPDILITNYSMLEYMLMRPIEQPIWNSTKQWLGTDHKLLFVIDEAHMYHGSSGGEVALLIRRLMYKLGIARDRVQFILTTASMPHDLSDDRKAVRQFALDLTSAESDNFEFLPGTRKPLSAASPRCIAAESFISYKTLHNDNEDVAFSKLRKFWYDAGISADCTSLGNMQDWMFTHLQEYEPFRSLLSECRGAARSLEELEEKLFSSLSQPERRHALCGLLNIVSQAKNNSGAYLFPVKLHMLYRGLSGVFACTNPQCGHAHHADGITLGQIYHQSSIFQCSECGGSVYEIINDRRCGALYIKGFIIGEPEGRQYLWPYSGRSFKPNMHEIHLYIPKENETFPQKKQKKAPIRPCYLDSQSGYLHFDDSMAGQPSVLKLYYSTYRAKGRPDVYTFSECPHCRSKLGHRELTSFRTRGNEPFYNLVKTQFNLEPPVERFKDLPNQGRKALLFSDSRQRAAKLARDMSNASDDQAVRQLFILAVMAMEKSESKTHSLNDLYGYFALEAAEKNVQLFHDERVSNTDNNNASSGSRSKFISQCQTVFNRKKNRNKSPDLQFDQAPSMMQQYLLRLYCSSYNNLYDTTLGWLEPSEDSLEEALDELSNDKISREEFIAIFNAWSMDICKRYGALGDVIPDIEREQALQGKKEGLEAQWQLPSQITYFLKRENLIELESKLREVLHDYFLTSSNSSGQFYLNLKKLRPCVSFSSQFGIKRTHNWYLCEKCSKVTPYPLGECCPSCGGPVHEMADGEYEALRFWLQPVYDAISGKSIRVINTEEHTAQLSYKDQRDILWSRTEHYEMRFQNLLKKENAFSTQEPPVDILSSTTTMEVGIDIGSLVAIGLRNIPPMRENYQQRAGRAGRRGMSLSTIVTFCEDGPHDAYYFSRPQDMLSGTPRRPWVDPNNKKLLYRHLNLIALEKFLERNGEGLDSLPAEGFFEENRYINWQEYLKSFTVSSPLVPADSRICWGDWRKQLQEKLTALNTRCQKHPELFEHGARENKKSILDALYEDGIIPTYSFPKNIVSMHICDSSGKTQYEVSRGLDIAISEYAPGRSIVVDKNTYKIGGFYYPGTDSYGREKSPAKKFLDDPNYHTSVYTCSHCSWFGLKENLKDNRCPFCFQEVEVSHAMVRPWGFAPINGTSTYEAQLEEDYSFAEPPLYSTVPAAETMKNIDGCSYIKIAQRANQNIIMLNKGPNNNGFCICKDCGAVVPRNAGEQEPLKKIDTPYHNRSYNPKCNHKSSENIFIGYSFMTDMLVLTIELNNLTIPRDDIYRQWQMSASTTLAEAIRLQASRLLDIEFTELNAGSRYREAADCIDIYIYDCLSSGAGYSSGIAARVKELLDSTEKFLADCPGQCSSACQECLQHYYNQKIHWMLNRYAALDLLRWSRTGKLPQAFSFEEQSKMLIPIQRILEQSGISLEKGSEGHQLINLYDKNYQTKKKLIIHPMLWSGPEDLQETVSLSDYELKYARPDAVEKIIKNFKERI